MPLWKLTLTYDGTDFSGWQVQPNLPTVQGALQGALLRLTGESVLPQGAGRTDAGVHALAQVASVSLTTPIPASNLRRALNELLPRSIRVLSVEPAKDPFHARHSARWKTYEYRIFPLRSLPTTNPAQVDDPQETGDAERRICAPTLVRYVWDCPFALDASAMSRAAQLVQGTHDFTSFAASGSFREDVYQPENPVPGYTTAPPTRRRTLLASCWTERDGLLVYQVTGSGFLQHMVRNLVGTFVLVGSGRLSPDAIPEILGSRQRSAAGPTAPARGLFLHSVEY